MLRPKFPTVYHPAHLIFQAVDWSEYDVEDPDNTYIHLRQYIIKVFGCDEKGRSVSANITGFKPFFYIKAVPLKNCTSTPPLNQFNISSLQKSINSALSSTQDFAFAKLSAVTARDMVGYKHNTKTQYIKVTMCNLTMFHRAKKLFDTSSKRFWSHGNGQRYKYTAYETNLMPFLRFIHIQKLDAAGWIQLTDWCIEDTVLNTSCQLNVSVEYTDVTTYSCPRIAPLVILSFDLECTSSHGDFPMAKKSYNKPANELIELYRSIPKNTHKRDLKSLLHKSLMDMLVTSDGKLSQVFPKHTISTERLQLLETDLFTVLDELLDILDDKCFIQMDQEHKTSSERITSILERILPPLKGDPIIQIGTTVHAYGDTSCKFKHVFTLNDCEQITDTVVVPCKTEQELITAWCDLIQQIDPDIVTGYNILGFDFDYLYQRAQENNICYALEACGRVENKIAKFTIKELASSALGDNTLKYLHMDGRILIDVMKVAQRDHKLDSYKLDNVAAVFIQGRIKSVGEDPHFIEVDRTFGLSIGSTIRIDNTKYTVENIHGNLLNLSQPVQSNQRSWGLVKDDVSPAQIFHCQKGTAADRAIVAKYCVQDCALCNALIIKLEILANNIGMANVCSVPLSFIFMRGQGIKIFSLVARQCQQDNIIMPVIKFDPDLITDEEDGYEGAIVLEPNPGIYVDEPISVMDYASLYPSSMISENISHDSIILDPAYDNLPGVEYVDITYDIYNGKGSERRVVGQKVCRFAQFPNGEKGILPRILVQLLSQRKSTRKRMQHKKITTNNDTIYEGLIIHTNTSNIQILQDDGQHISIDNTNVNTQTDRYDEFEKAVLDGLQLAYKITANSLYGQVGATTSPIFLKELAASTTATGRSLIMQAKNFMETNYGATTIYGDTDSVFVDFGIKKKYGLSGKDALQKSIDVAIHASKAFKCTLKAPHDLEYEKTFWPFIIISKKRYIGNLYEHDVEKFKQKGMGIVLKRRDNANILKIVYGGIIDILLNTQDVSNAISFLQTSLHRISHGEFPLDDLVITKTLRSFYNDPSRIAHKVLADRMRSRDPGSAPQSNDRIPYVFILHDRKDKSLLQGDKIEHPEYIKTHQLTPDYEYYITNQLQNPIAQVFALVLEQIPGYNKSIFENTIAKKKRILAQNGADRQTVQKFILSAREQEAKRLLFFRTLNTLQNKRSNIKEITHYFGYQHAQTNI